ncbi:MAG: ABC-type transport auxiliary lipoprotein family protein [Pseudomonadota bacterium]
MARGMPWASALVAALAGCVSVLPEQAVPNALYRIDRPAPVAGADFDTVVREPTSAQIFGGQGMVVQGADGGLRLIEGVEWAGRLTRLMQSGLVDALSGGGEGIAVTELSGVPGAREIVWRVADMTIIGDAAVCRLDVTVLDGRRRAPLADADIERTSPVAGRSGAERAAALSRVGAACLEAAAAFIASVEAPTPPPT